MFDGIPTVCFSLEVPKRNQMKRDLIESIAMRLIWEGVNVLMNQVLIDAGRMEDYD